MNTSQASSPNQVARAYREGIITGPRLVATLVLLAFALVSFVNRRPPDSTPFSEKKASLLRTTQELSRQIKEVNREEDLVPVYGQIKEMYQKTVSYQSKTLW